MKTIPRHDASAPSANDSGLTPGQRAMLGAELTLRLRQLERQRDELQGGTTRAEHAAAVLSQDGDDAPQRDADREVDLARNDRVVRDLAETHAALSRLQSPDFGLCSRCGGAIAFDRLRIEPWALRCTPCQAATEGAAATRRPGL